MPTTTTTTAAATAEVRTLSSASTASHTISPYSQKQIVGPYSSLLICRNQACAGLAHRPQDSPCGCVFCESCLTVLAPIRTQEEMVASVPHQAAVLAIQQAQRHTAAISVASTTPTFTYRICPSCAIPHPSSLHPSNIVSHQVKNVQLRCANAEVGCPYISVLGEDGCNHIRHMVDCEYVKVECIFAHEIDSECKQQVMRKDVPFHLLHECPERNVTCEDCNSSLIKSKNLKGHRNANMPLHSYCSNKTSCPNGCPDSSNCTSVHLITDLSRHISYDCRYQLEKCLICPLLKRRCEMGEHMAQAQEAHMLELARGKNSDQAKIEALQQKVRAMESEMQDLHESVLMLQLAKPKVQAQ